MTHAILRQIEATGFVSRVYRLRIVGLGLGAFPVGAVLYELDAAPWVWALLVGNGIVWPHLAHALARRSADPIATERRNLLADAAFAGAWIAAIHLNLVPGVLLVSMMAMDRTAAGGLGLVARALPLMFAACVIVWALLGFPFRPESSLRVVLASVPFLIAYPMLVASVVHTLAGRVRRQNRALEQLSRTDELTGLNNRRHFHEAVDAELRRFRRSGRPAALLVFDIDDFKGINDSHGHAAGDHVLQQLGAMLRGIVRDIDTAGRLGGDEFGVVLPETDRAGAERVAERLRQTVSSRRFDGWPGLHVTLSIGVVEASADVRAYGAWMERADLALYRAKSAGRDRVA